MASPASTTRQQPLSGSTFPLRGRFVWLALLEQRRRRRGRPITDLCAAVPDPAFVR